MRSPIPSDNRRPRRAEARPGPRDSPDGTILAAAAAVPAAPGHGANALGLSLVHGQGPALDRLPVQPADRRLGLPVGGHLDEPEPLRPAGVPVGDELGRLDAPERG